MSDVLSQSEIDALLSALTSGEVNADDIRSQNQPSKIRNYDFRRAMRFSKDHIRIITRIHEHFARLLTTHLSGQLRNFVQIQVESVDQVPYEEFIRSIPILTVIHVLELSPLEGKVVLEMNPQIVFAILDLLMGGTIHGSYRERELTDIEVSLLTTILSRMTDFLSDAWRNVSVLQPEFVSLESNPQFLQLTTPNETVLVITLSAKVGSATGLMTMCIPHVTIEPLLPHLTRQYFMEETKNKVASNPAEEKVAKHLQGVPVSVTVKLGDSELSVQELLDLQIGDTITLNQKIRKPVLVSIDDVPTYLAGVGRMKQRYAVKILEEFGEVSEDGGRETFTGRN